MAWVYLGGKTAAYPKMAAWRSDVQSPHSATQIAVKAKRKLRGMSMTRTRAAVAAKRARRRARGRTMRRVRLCSAAALAWRTRRAWKSRLLAIKVREKTEKWIVAKEGKNDCEVIRGVQDW